MITPPADTFDADGKPLQPYEGLVEVGRKVEWAEPDRAANIYMIDRAVGKPRQSLEVTGKNEGPLKIEVVYSDAHPPDPDAEDAPGPGVDPQEPGAI
jgi:hypothetical protein